MSNNRFTEFVAVERNIFQDLLENTNKETPAQPESAAPTTVPPVIVSKVVEEKSDVIHQRFKELIQDLPPRSRIPATQIIRQLVNGVEFGMDRNSGKLVHFLPQKGYRYRLQKSNVYDILNALCKQDPLPMPEQKRREQEEEPYGMKVMLEMISNTSLGSTQIVNCKYRFMLQEYRK